MAATLLGIIFAVLVYQHASGQKRYNRLLVTVMMCLCLVLCIPAFILGWRKNPARKAGGKWKELVV